MNTNTWTHPRTGQVRHYLSSAEVWDAMPGRAPASDLPYSGADAARVLAAKFWLDEDGVLHIDRLEERGRILAADVRAVVEAELAPEAEEVETEQAEAEVVATVQTEDVEDVEQLVEARFWEDLMDDAPYVSRHCQHSNTDCSGCCYACGAQAVASVAAYL